jgi:hypothetical protein
VTSEYIAYVYDDVKSAWTQIGFAAVATGPEALVGLAVTSHDTGVLNTSSFDNVVVFKNLLEKWSFEEYSPPALGTPGWISDTPFRQIDAKSETNQPHNGAKNGACWATTNEDCGIYQEAIAPYDANYVFTIFANADRPGGLVGVNVNGRPVCGAGVPVRGFGNYGVTPLRVPMSARAGDIIRVWMYSPATPGYVVIDDAALTLDPTNP